MEMDLSQIRFLDDGLKVSRLDWIITNMAGMVATESDVDNRDVLIAGMQELAYRQAKLRSELAKRDNTAQCRN